MFYVNGYQAVLLISRIFKKGLCRIPKSISPIQPGQGIIDFFLSKIKIFFLLVNILDKAHNDNIGILILPDWHHLFYNPAISASFQPFAEFPMENLLFIPIHPLCNVVQIPKLKECFPVIRMYHAFRFFGKQSA